MNTTLEDVVNAGFDELPSVDVEQRPRIENDHGKRKESSKRSMAVTSVSSALKTLAHHAATALGGMRMCADGREDGKLTHLGEKL
jgi:hypothetical protein